MTSEITPQFSFLCPTRGRPREFRRMCESIAKHSAVLSAIEVIAYVDEDDLTSQSLDFCGVLGRVIVGKQCGMAEANAICLNAAQGGIILLMNDDVVIRTDAWDTLLKQHVIQFKDEIFLAYPNDLFKGSKLCTFPILSKKCYDLLKDPFPKQYEGNFIDTHLFDIFQRLKKLGQNRIVYCHDIVFEHMHYRLGKANLDETYKARKRFGNDMHFIELDPVRYQAAYLLKSEIENTTFPEKKKTAYYSLPNHFLSAFFLYLRLFFLNGELPIRWRIWLFIHFSGRYWASKFIA